MENNKNLNTNITTESTLQRIQMLKPNEKKMGIVNVIEQTAKLLRLNIKKTS